MKRYITIWWLLTSAAAQNSFSSRFGALVLIIGKIIRFSLFFLFLYVIGTKTKLIAGYTLPEMVLFYLTFQLIDLLPQFFMREVYRFRQYIVTGDFDYFLVRPFSPLFRSLFGGTDPLDLPMVILTIIFLIVSIGTVFHGSVVNICIYIFFLCNALLIALAFHIGIVSLGILTTEVDSAILLYRDITLMGRIPIDIYKQPLQAFLTFIIPVAIMMTLPGKSLLGLATTPIMIFAVCISILLFYSSLRLWRYALASYASASS